jgi:adenosine deaminase
MFIRYLLLPIAFALFSTAFAESDTDAEHNTATYFQHIQNNPEQLLIFLQNMPKGADLHYHQGSGASLAEHLIQYGQGEHFCINPKNNTVFQDAHCAAKNSLDNVVSNPPLYNYLIDAWSMRDFNPNNESGHDHFFGIFGKIGALASAHEAETTVETIQRAAEQNESYLELIVIPDNNASGVFAKNIPWNSDLASLRKTLLARGLEDIVLNIKKTMDRREAKEKNILACNTDHPDKGCNVIVRYLYTTLREQPPVQVFAQLLTGFEIASKDPRFVGINLVQEEDGYISMRDYHLHMTMIAFLHQLYPQVAISLHAGELNSNLVPADGLRFHIREAVEIAQAQRIGHGVDIALEKNADQLLKEMRQKHILVEINLTSNEDILNMSGANHPLPLYLNYHVPVALSTDDEGITRTTLTLEFQKAILRYHLSYEQVKELVRNSLFYSFLSGKNLWKDGTYHAIQNECAHDRPGFPLSTSCQQFLNTSLKANKQWDLENRFRLFEQTQYSAVSSSYTSTTTDRPYMSTRCASTDTNCSKNST